ncbi:hypothetical protein JTB14_037519 [Gonioctena quinquepunctata]|nr:hypothetical protein JTB14_037519 [Gonioctena quinquepunctata]
MLGKVRMLKENHIICCGELNNIEKKDEMELSILEETITDLISDNSLKDNHMEKMKRELELINRESIEMESSLNLQIAEQQEMINSLKNQLKTLQNLNAEIEAKTDKNICSSMDTIPMTYADKSTRTETDNIQHPRGVDKGSMTETGKGIEIDCAVQTTEVMETEAKQERKSIEIESFQSKKTEEITNSVKQNNKIINNKNKKIKLRQPVVKKQKIPSKRTISSLNHWKIENIPIESVKAKTLDDNISRTRTSNIIHLVAEINVNTSESSKLTQSKNKSNLQGNEPENSTGNQEMSTSLQTPANSGGVLPAKMNHQELQDKAKMNQILVLGDEYANNFPPVLDQYIIQEFHDRTGTFILACAGELNLWWTDETVKFLIQWDGASLEMAQSWDILKPHACVACIPDDVDSSRLTENKVMMN